MAWVPISVLPLSYVTLGKKLNLSVLMFLSVKWEEWQYLPVLLQGLKEVVYVECSEQGMAHISAI